MIRNERVFCGEIPKSLKSMNKKVWYWKIRDDGGIQPFDSFLVSDGIPYAIEVKFSRGINTINMSKLFSNRIHQIHSLLRFKKAGGKSIVLINCFVANKFNRVFFITPELAQKYIEKGTVKIKDFILNNNVIEINKIPIPIPGSTKTESVWNVSHIFNSKSI